MNDPARFFVCSMRVDALEGALLIIARSADEAAAVFKESEAVAPVSVYEVIGAGTVGRTVGRVKKKDERNEAHGA